MITLFGIAFLLAIAIAAGIFGPVPRTISGALLAAALVAGGVVARGRSPEKAGGEALVATGLAAAYLDLLAATALYHFIPGAAGLVLGAILTVGAFLLAREWNSQLLAVLAAAPPALLAPAITGIGSVLTLSFVALLLVGSAFAHLGRTWPWLYIARIMPAVPVLVIGVIASRASDVTIIAMMTATALAMIAAGSTERSRQIALAPTTAAVLAAAPLLWAVILLRDDRLAITAALAALFLVVAAATASWTRNGGESAAVSASLWTAPLITGTVLVVIAAAELSPRSLIGLALAGASAAYLLVAAWRRSVAVANAGAVLAALSAFGFLEIVGSIGSLSLTAPRADGWAIGHGLALTAVAALGAYTVRALSTGAANPHLTRLAAGVMLVTISTTVVLTGTWLGSLQGEPRLGFYGGHATATALWTAAAGLLLTVFARRSRDRAFAVRTGLGLIAAAVVKLFLFDLSALGGLFRVLAFIASGVIVLVIGASYSRAPEGPRYGEVTPPGPPAPGPAAPGPVDHGPGAADPQQALRQPVPKSTPEETAPSPSPQQEPSDTASSRH